MKTEPSSFRDPGSQVFYQGEKVYRYLNATALHAFKQLESSKAWQNLSPLLVKTRETPGKKGRWAGALEHEKISFISYPYEWCFSQLKDAALCQLEIMLHALEADFISVDASAYNFQFKATQPLLIDIPSLVPSKGYRLWPGYQQFCQMFLFPLMLQAYRGIEFQPEMRAQLEGISAERMLKIISRRDLLRKGVFSHVYLQARAQRRYAAMPFLPQKELQSLDISTTIIRHNVRSLKKIVKKMHWAQARSLWSEYAHTHSYSKEAQGVKEDFVTKVLKSKKSKLVFDLGCNTGSYSLLASQYSDYVVAVDGDQLAIERLYFQLKQQNKNNILPLVLNLADPSPNRGWQGLERRAFFDRAQPDLVMALALVHHLAISNNIPLEQLVEWFSQMKATLIIEFVTKQDPMVQTLLQSREDIFDNYNQQHFEKCLAKKFRIVTKKKIPGNTRIIYHAQPKGRR